MQSHVKSVWDFWYQQLSVKIFVSSNYHAYKSSGSPGNFRRFRVAEASEEFQEWSMFYWSFWSIFLVVSYIPVALYFSSTDRKGDLLSFVLRLLFFFGLFLCGFSALFLFQCFSEKECTQEYFFIVFPLHWELFEKEVGFELPSAGFWIL